MPGHDHDDITPELLLRAYASGIFPMAEGRDARNVFWVDPERDLTFVCLTAGVMEDSDNILRFQRLSDLVVAATVDG